MRQLILEIGNTI